MTDPIRHIEYLLLRHDCVVVPGLGAFMAVYEAAKFDKENGLILPPFVRIAFNQAIAVEDGLLANSISRKEGIGFTEAKILLARFVSNINAEMATGKDFAFGNIGTFSRGETGNLIFTSQNPKPAREGNLPASLKAKEKRKSKEVPSQGMLYTDRNTRRGFRRRSTITRIAAAVALVMLVSIAVLFHPVPAEESEQRASVIPVDAIVSVGKTAVETPAPPSSGNEFTVVADEPAEEKPQTDYYLIVGTFSSETEAAKFVKANSSEENPMEIVPSRRLFRVSVAASSDFNELRTLLNSQETTTRYPGAWIWSSK